MITEEQKDYIKTHYADMTNKEIGEKLGLNPHTVTHWGYYKFGLHKSEALRAELRRRGVVAAAEHTRIHGVSEERIAKLIESSKHARFQKGNNLRERLGEERYAERNRKAGETRKKTIRAERRRLIFGLPQRTKLNVAIEPQSTAKISLRLRMRKHGYIEDKANHIFYRPKDVPPRPRAEKVMIDKYKYEIKEL